MEGTIDKTIRLVWFRRPGAEILHLLGLNTFSEEQIRVRLDAILRKDPDFLQKMGAVLMNSMIYAAFKGDEPVFEMNDAQQEIYKTIKSGIDISLMHHEQKIALAKTAINRIIL